MRGVMNNGISDLREFGKFRLDIGKKVLWCDEKPVSLPLKAIELLCVLVERKGEVITKDEIWNAVWQDAFVEETNLTHNIYILRKTLKSLGEKNLIQTVPRRGYRFTGEVRAIETGEIIIEKHTRTQTLIEIEEEGEKQRNGTSLKRNFLNPQIPVFRAAFLVLFAVVIGSIAFFGYQAFQTELAVSEIKSIAVLPLKSFVAESADESLQLRITDALITRLGGFDKIAVRSTNSVLPFTDTEKNALEIGKELQVDVVLDGRIQKENNRLRVTLQLINVADGTHIWSEQFDGQAHQILNLQDAVTAGVLKALNQDRHKPADLAARPTENPEAFEAYLQGRYFASKRTGEGLYKAIEYFQQAVALDAQFAEAYAGLADTEYLLFDYNFETSKEQVLRARANLQRALSIKPEFADALTTLGSIQMNYDWDWANAEKSLRQATESAPNSSAARMRFGALLLRLARFDEAQNQFEQALALDPLSVIGIVNLGMVNFCKKDFAAAERHYKKAFEINDQYGSTHWLYSRSLWLEGKKDEAIKEIVRGLELDKNEPLARRIEEKARTESPDAAIKLLLYEWRENPSKTNPHNLAYLSAISGDYEKAVFWLEKSFEENHPWTTWIKAAPEFEVLANEPRYREILRKMNL